MGEAHSHRRREPGRVVGTLLGVMNRTYLGVATGGVKSERCLRETDIPRVRSDPRTRNAGSRPAFFARFLTFMRPGSHGGRGSRGWSYPEITRRRCLGSRRSLEISSRLCPG